ncbi:MAG: hypothetical protein D6788_05965 [Planctomycetota bacterium]|nr:MAG: hypothetical protein D6788_05965 [Planctomycetota bacterium]
MDPVPAVPCDAATDGGKTGAGGFLSPPFEKGAGFLMAAAADIVDGYKGRGKKPTVTESSDTWRNAAPAAPRPREGPVCVKNMVFSKQLSVSSFVW